MTRIINEPEFQDTRNKLQLLKCCNTHGNNALHIACLSGSFKIVLTLLRVGADPLWNTLSTNENAFDIAKRYDLTSGKKMSLLTLMKSYMVDLKLMEEEGDDGLGRKKKKKKKKKKKQKKY